MYGLKSGIQSAGAVMETKAQTEAHTPPPKRQAQNRQTETVRITTGMVIAVFFGLIGFFFYGGVGAFIGIAAAAATTMVHHVLISHKTSRHTQIANARR